MRTHRTTAPDSLIASRRETRLRRLEIWALQVVYLKFDNYHYKMESVAKQDQPRPNPSIRVFMPDFIDCKNG